MIFGIGTDICDIRRIEKSLNQTGSRFAQKVLTAYELKIWHERRLLNPARGARFVATRFCVKEAFGKAIGLGVRSPMALDLCEVQSSENGQPFIVLHGELKTWFEAQNLRAHVSLSDEADYACAFVVVEQG